MTEYAADAPAIEVHVTDDDRRHALERDVRAGLLEHPRSLPAKWLYDERGGVLFGQITQLPEYYPTRAEARILREVEADLPLLAPARTIVELGAGDSPKTLQLVSACAQRGSLERFVAFDIDEESLRRCTTRVASTVPDIDVSGVLADMVHDLHLLPDGEQVLVALLGSTIGNFLPAQRHAFYRDVAARLRAGSWMLVGYDLVKDPAVIEAAYNDSAGVTSQFTHNILTMLNRELDGDFDEAAFAHEARWMPDEELVRVGLRALAPQHVRLEAIDVDVDLAEGELLHLEVCCKFRRDVVAAELAEAGFAVDGWWTDADEAFALCLARRS
jgi:L-histidine N-alpha-methyltransferase